MRTCFQPVWTICAVAIAMVPIQSASAEDPTRPQIKQATAGDLAISYLNAKVMLQTIKMAEAGIQIVTPEGTITKSNAARFLASYQARQKLYADAIEERGYQNQAGSYRVLSADPSCRRSYSTLLAGASVEGGISALLITQTGPDIAMSITLHEPQATANEPSDIKLDTMGATTEDAIAVIDPMNSDYLLEGKVAGKTITWHARPEVLKFWPKWAPAPTKADLAQCTVVVERIE